MTGQLWIRSAGEADELRLLLDWLRREDALRGRVRPVTAPIGPGQMGGIMDAVVVAAGAGGMGAVLAGALTTWIQQRRADVRLTITGEDGRKIEVDAKRVDPQALIRDVERLLE